METLMHILDRAWQAVWLGGLAVIPVAGAVGLLCVTMGGARFRPATRHMLWAVVLVSFVTPAFALFAGLPAQITPQRISEWASMLMPASDGPSSGSIAGAEPAKAAQSDGQTAAKSSLEPKSNSDGVNPGTSYTATDVPRFAIQEPSIIAKTGTWQRPVSVQPTNNVPSRRLERAVPVAKSLPMETRDSLATPLEHKAQAPSPREIAPTPVPKVRIEQGPSEWVLWIDHVREAIATIPAMPSWIWMAGVGVVAGVWVARCVRVRRLLAKGRPAGTATLALVSEVSRAAGLSRPPTVLMVGEPVSPMVWCGLKPVLVLPAELWSTLDTTSRRVIVAHEIAHLRRRDHRLAWLMGVIGVLYWWHPLAWWTRRRVRDEAELSCDAWVMRWLPQERRAYAYALVHTQAYLSQYTRSAGPGLGVLSGSASKLARRITMVMTNSTSPRMSVLGAVMALALAGAGAIVTPVWACPPGTSEGHKEAKAPKAARAGQAVIVAPRAKARGSGQSGGFGKASGGGAAGEIEFFGEAPALEAMKGKPRSQSPRAPRFPGEPGSVAGLSMPPTPAAPPAPGAPPSPPVAALAPLRAVGGLTTVPVPSDVAAAYGVVGPGSSAVATTVPGQDMAIESRSYRVSEGKLDDLYDLMRRNDVPIFVSGGNGEITVQATPSQHEVFGAFVAMIDPETAGRAQGGANTVRGRALVERQRAGEAQRAAREAARESQRMRAEADRLRTTAARARDEAGRMRNAERQLIEAQRQLEGQAAAAENERAKEALAEAAERLQERREAVQDQSSLISDRLAEIEERLAELEASAEQLIDNAEAFPGSGEDDREVDEFVDEIEVEGVPMPDDFEGPADEIEVEGVPMPETDEMTVEGVEIRPASLSMPVYVPGFTSVYAWGWPGGGCQSTVPACESMSHACATASTCESGAASACCESKTTSAPR